MPGDEGKASISLFKAIFYGYLANTSKIDCFKSIFGFRLYLMHTISKLASILMCRYNVC